MLGAMGKFPAVRKSVKSVKQVREQQRAGDTTGRKQVHRCSYCKEPGHRLETCVRRLRGKPKYTGPPPSPLKMRKSSKGSPLGACRLCHLPGGHASGKRPKEEGHSGGDKPKWVKNILPSAMVEDKRPPWPPKYTEKTTKEEQRVRTRDMPWKKSYEDPVGVAEVASSSTPTRQIGRMFKSPTPSPSVAAAKAGVKPGKRVHNEVKSTGGHGNAPPVHNEGKSPVPREKAENGMSLAAVTSGTDEQVMERLLRLGLIHDGSGLGCANCEGSVGLVAMPTSRAYGQMGIYIHRCQERGCNGFGKGEDVWQGTISGGLSGTKSGTSRMTVKEAITILWLAIHRFAATDARKLIAVNPKLYAIISVRVRKVLEWGQQKSQVLWEQSGFRGELEADETGVRKQRIPCRHVEGGYKVLHHRIPGVLERGTRNVAVYQLPPVTVAPGAPPPPISSAEWAIAKKYVQAPLDKKFATIVHPDGARAYCAQLPKGCSHDEVAHGGLQFTKFAAHCRSDGKKVKTIAGAQALDGMWTIVKKGICRRARIDRKRQMEEVRRMIWEWSQQGGVHLLSSGIGHEGNEGAGSPGDSGRERSRRRQRGRHQRVIGI